MFSRFAYVFLVHDTGTLVRNVAHVQILCKIQKYIQNLFICIKYSFVYSMVDQHRLAVTHCVQYACIARHPCVLTE